jgi:ribosomal protein L28
MAQTCDFCGKNRHKAHKVSHSNIKTRKWQQPNLQSIRACQGRLDVHRPRSHRDAIRLRSS